MNALKRSGDQLILCEFPEESKKKRKSRGDDDDDEILDISALIAAAPSVSTARINPLHLF